MVMFLPVPGLCCVLVNPAEPCGPAGGLRTSATSATRRFLCCFFGGFLGDFLRGFLYRAFARRTFASGTLAGRALLGGLLGCAFARGFFRSGLLRNGLACDLGGLLRRFLGRLH